MVGILALKTFICPIKIALDKKKKQFVTINLTNLRLALFRKRSIREVVMYLLMFLERATSTTSFEVVAASIFLQH